MIKVPFFHYTYLDNLYDIIANGQIHSRSWMIKHENEFEDISIDTEQSLRDDMLLLEYARYLVVSIHYIGRMILMDIL